MADAETELNERASRRCNLSPDETALERQWYRAMNQLERRQRHRLGEAVPAPLVMDLSTRS